MKNIINVLLFCIFILPCQPQNIYWQGVTPDLEDIDDFSFSSFLRSIGEENTDGITLNTLGLEAYKQNDLLLAAKIWRCSIYKNDNYHWSHYNYACALALIAESLGINPADYEHSYYLVPTPGNCDILYAYTEKIFYHLKKSISLNSDIFHKMQEDSDLSLIRDMDEYKFMLFYPENDTIDILNSVETWYGSDTGVFQDGGYAYFEGNEITIIVVKQDESSFDKTGTFYFHANRMIIDIETPARETLEGRVDISLDSFGFIRSVDLFIGTRFYSNSDPNIGGA
jgi:hypothetical protein